MWTFDGMLTLVLLSAVVMGMSHTIAKERVFAPMRERLGGKSTWLGYLVSCPYCVSHWLAFMLVPLVGTYPLQIAFRLGWVEWVIEWFLASVLVTVIAAFLRVAFWWMDETQALVRKKKTREEVETDRQRILRDRLDDDVHAPH